MSWPFQPLLPGVAQQEAGATGAYTLNAQPASFTLAGQAATLRVGRVPLAAAGGAFTLTGQTAGLKVGRKLGALAGSFTLTGQDATLTYTPATSAYTLIADGGVFTLAGQDATLTVQRVAAPLTAAPGPLMLSPKAYRALQAKRRKADEELERLRQTEEAKRASRRAMITRAVRGEPEPVAAQPAPEPGPTPPPPQPAKKARKPVHIANIEAPIDDHAPRIAALQVRIAEIESAIAAHEEAIEEDDMETMLLLVA